MQFNFNYRVKPKDLFLLAMVNTYNSMAGVVNIVFTISMGMLMFRFWSESSLLIKLFITFGLLLFPIFQPLSIFIRSKKIVSTIPENMQMYIDSFNIAVVREGERNIINRKEIISIKKIRKMIIINAGKKGVYILNRQSLEGRLEEVYNFLKY